MRRRFAVIALGTLLGSLPLCAQDPILDSESGHRCFVDLLRRAAWGLGGSFERAAFIVQQPNGAIGCVPWPPKHSYLEESFHGLVPAGTVALVHTHPAVYPSPSEHDIHESTRVGMPIYVISIHGVFRADPHTANVFTVARGQAWIHQMPRATIADSAAGASR